MATTAPEACRFAHRHQDFDSLHVWRADHFSRFLKHAAAKLSDIPSMASRVQPMYWLVTIICTVIITGALLLVAGIDFLF